jgi:hypothetical protein
MIRDMGVCHRCGGDYLPGFRCCPELASWDRPRRSSYVTRICSRCNLNAIGCPCGDLAQLEPREVFYDYEG